jgi:hypothetical protein
MLNVQIDAIDRKMRSVAIKRSESLKVSFYFKVSIGNFETNFISSLFGNIFP